jgi:hypothetical protein
MEEKGDTRLTKCYGVVRASQLMSETAEEVWEIFVLSLLGLSITGPNRVAEIDVEAGKVESWVDSRIRDWSRTLIRSSHLVMKVDEMVEINTGDCKTHISSS